MSTSDAKQRFSSRVEYYLRARPRYPNALLEFFRDELKLRSEHRMADVGSGTGFLTELFLANGNEVFVVEPNAEMRFAGEQLLQPRYPKLFHSIAGAAEATTLPGRSVDFITAGAFYVDRATAPEALRLAFSMYPPEDLTEAGRRLGAAVSAAR